MFLIYLLQGNRQMKKTLCFLLCSTALFSTAYAWNSNGHNVIAQIAYDNLRPETLAQVEMLIPIVGQYYNLTQFVDAAPWADWLKSDNVTAFNSWHYIDQPITQGHCSKCTWPLPAPNPANIVWAIQQAQQVLTTPSSTQFPQQHTYEKSWFLLYLEHFVGDIHQPLHTVTLYSNTFPDNAAYPSGDQGGNLYVIQSSIGNNLHTYWDQGAGIFSGPSMSDAQIQSLAIQIEKKYPMAYFGKKTMDLDPNDWATESRQLAEDVAYTLPENTRPTIKYKTMAQKTATQQAALAGYRLAILLNQIFD